MICEEQQNYFAANCPEGNLSLLRKHYVFSRPVSSGPLMDSTPCSGLCECVCVGKRQKEGKKWERSSMLTLMDCTLLPLMCQATANVTQNDTLNNLWL